MINLSDTDEIGDELVTLSSTSGILNEVIMKLEI
jgi:hypothetical protein